jgi:hypothetical protein
MRRDTASGREQSHGPCSPVLSVCCMRRWSAASAYRLANSEPHITPRHEPCGGSLPSSLSVRQPAVYALARSTMRRSPLLIALLACLPGISGTHTALVCPDRATAFVFR